MNNNSLKQEVDEIMKIEGNVRGHGILADISCIEEKKGEQGLNLVLKKLAELGYPLDPKDIKSFDWWKEAHDVALVLVAKELFNWTDKDIFDMGSSAPKFSLFTKILVKYLISAKRTFKEGNLQWRKLLDFGRLEPVEFNDKEKYSIIRIIGYKFHPLLCIYQAGYLLRLAEYVIPSRKIEIKETKCVFKGDEYNEYILTWQ